MFVDSLDALFNETFEIKNDSLFDIVNTVRETETGSDLDCRFFMETIYIPDNGVF